LEIAETPWERMRGLLGRDGLAPGEGMLFPGCSSIHTCFMRFAIDVVYLDAERRTVKIVERLKPWRLSGCRGARDTLELAAGHVAATDVRTGARLALVEDR
jgi:hypothetical protein